MTDELIFRDATADDASDLAILADAAGRRIVAWMWDQEAEPGQSSFEVGRESIRSDSEGPDHFTQWRVVESDGHVVGALNSLRLKPPSSDPASVSEVVRGLLELKAMAAGTWYITVASVFPESRGQGIGHAILTEAERLAAEDGNDRISLLVLSANSGALRLYERFGYTEWDRRPLVPFPGSDPEGDWMLMVKDLA